MSIVRLRVKEHKHSTFVPDVLRSEVITLTQGKTKVLIRQVDERLFVLKAALKDKSIVSKVWRSRK